MGMGANVEKSYNAASELQETAGLQMDTKSSKCLHLVEGGTNGSQDVNMAPMGKTSLGRVIHARRRQKTSFTNLETHGDGSGYLACDTCSSGVPNEIVPAGIVPIGNILVGNNIGFQKRTKGDGPPNIWWSYTPKMFDGHGASWFCGFICTFSPCSLFLPHYTFSGVSSRSGSSPTVRL